VDEGQGDGEGIEVCVMVPEVIWCERRAEAEEEVQDRCRWASLSEACGEEREKSVLTSWMAYSAGFV
jgi:hypothetical protein